MYKSEERDRLVREINNLLNSKDQKFSFQLENAKSLEVDGNDAVYYLAYFMMQRYILMRNIQNAKGRLERRGVNPQVIEEIFKVNDDDLQDKITRSDMAFYEQNQKVRKSLIKPAFKKDITTERVFELYKKYKTYKAVADILGVDPRTVKSRLKNM